MFKRKKQIPMKYRKQMSAMSGKASGSGMFKHQDTAYVKWLKEQLERSETRDKLLSYRNDIIQANERVNYRNQIDRMNDETQRDNLSFNTIEQLQRQRNQFRNLYG
jgi:hypothetical protein